MAGGSRAKKKNKKKSGTATTNKHGVASSPPTNRQTRSSTESTAKKSNQSHKDSSPKQKDQLKSPDRKKAKASSSNNPLSPVPFAPSTQKTGNQASATALKRFDVHICASGEQFCRAPWTIPIGHTCVVCKSKVHSFCYGSHGENIPTICAQCVSPVGVMAGVIAPVGCPDGFEAFYKEFLQNQVDHIDNLSGKDLSGTNFYCLKDTDTSNVFSPPGLPSTVNEEQSESSPSDDEVSGSDPDTNASNTASVDGDTGAADEYDNGQPGDEDQNEAQAAPPANQDRSTNLPEQSIAEKSFEILKDSAKSVRSDKSDNTTQRKNTDRIAVRCFVCQSIPKFDRNLNFNPIFAAHFNTFLSSIMEIEPLIRLIKWSAKSADIEKDAITAITHVPNEYEEFLYFTFRAESPGKKYIRVQLSIPSDCDIDDVLMKLKGSGKWWSGWNNFARQVGSLATKPKIIGWFMRSTSTHIASRDLQTALRVIVDDPTLGLEYQRITQEPKSAVMNYRRRAINIANPKRSTVQAVHVEVEEDNYRRTLNKLEKVYNGKDCPLGINFHFVREINMPKMQTRSGRGGHAKCSIHQHAFSLMVDYIQAEIHNIDGTIAHPEEDVEMSLRQMLMSLKVKTIKDCVGDRLFLSVNREAPNSQIFLFEAHTVVLSEATEVVQFLPVILREIFLVDPKNYLDYASCKDCEGMEWDEDKRLGIDPAMKNFEALVEGLPSLLRDDGSEGGFEGMDDLAKAMYKRAVGECDETFISDTSRHRQAISGLKNVSGQSKKHSGIEIDLDGQSIRSALSSSTTTSKVDLAKKEITAEFTSIINEMKADRLREKEESSQMLDLLRSELENTRLAMSQQGLLLARLTSAPNAPGPGVSSNQQSSAPPVSNVPPYSSYPPRDSPDKDTVHPSSSTDPSSASQASQIPLPPDANDSSQPHSSVPLDNPVDQAEPGSGSNGAEAP